MWRRDKMRDIGNSKVCVCEKCKAGWTGGIDAEPFSGEI